MFLIHRCSPLTTAETELISSEDTLQSNPIHSWLNIHHTLSPFLSENFILGRPYLNWQHAVFRHEIQHRYVKSDLMRRRIHTELANAFYLGFTDVRHFNLPPQNLLQSVSGNEAAKNLRKRPS